MSGINAYSVVKCAMYRNKILVLLRRARISAMITAQPVISNQNYSPSVAVLGVCKQFGSITLNPNPYDRAINKTSREQTFTRQR